MSAVARSMPNLEWMTLEHVWSMKVVDISPIKPPVVINRSSHVPGGPTPAVCTPGSPGNRYVELTGEITSLNRASIAYGYFEYYNVDDGPSKSQTIPVELTRHEKTDVTVPGSGLFTERIGNEPGELCLPSGTYKWRALARSDGGLGFPCCSCAATWDPETDPPCSPTNPVYPCTSIECKDAYPDYNPEWQEFTIP